MSNPPESILKDRARLTNWIEANPGVAVDARNAHLAGVNLSNLDLKSAVFGGAVLEGADFRGADLTKAQFHEAKMGGAKLGGAILDRSGMRQVDLNHATLDEARIRGAGWSSANLFLASANNVDFRGSNLESAMFRGASLRNCKMDGANLKGANFTESDLRGASFKAANLTNTAWQGARVSAGTMAEPTVWISGQHDSPNDGADQLRLGIRQVVNWQLMRFVGRLPLFSGSYLLLTGSLSVTTAVHWLNDTQVLQSMRYPIPMPPRVVVLLLGSALLAVGATVFEIACPPRVKEFSFTQFVEELRRPGLLYTCNALQKPMLAGIAMIFVAAGGLLVGGVFIERVYHALDIAVRAIL